MTEISPQKGWVGEATDVVISGANFFPTVQAEARGDGAEINRSFEAWLAVDGEPVAALERVSLSSRSELTAQVPQGVPASTVYDLVVRAPDGGLGQLEDAFLVTASRADHFILTNLDDRPFWTILDTASFSVQVVDPDGEKLVDERVPVRISVEPVDDTPLDVTFDSDILLEQVPARGRYGAAIEGTLDYAGGADIEFSVATPAKVALTVEALEPGVEPARSELRWTTGTDYNVEIVLPSPNYRTVAGASVPVRLILRDEHGVIAWEPVIPLGATLRDSCSDVSIPFSDFNGVIDLDLVFEEATGTSRCPTQRLDLDLELGGVQRFSSSSFTVDPGLVDGFDVSVATSEVVAGTPLVATVRPVDAFGNVAEWTGVASSLLLTDNIGDVEARGCSAGDVFMTCTVTPTDAERGVVLEVRDPTSALAGASQSYDVLPAGLDYLSVAPDPDDMVGGVVAGSVLHVAVGLHDEFGNDVSTDEIVEGDVILGDDAGEVDCTFVGPGERGQIEFECTHFRADTETVLEAAGPGGVRGTSATFAVINAELAEVSVTPATISVTAGETFDLTLLAYDAYGNPYLVQSSNLVDLADTTGTLSVDHAVLDANGQSVQGVAITAVGQTVITASRFGVELGSSPLIEVSPDTASSLEITSRDAWGWVGDSLTVDIVAVDRFGNPTRSSDDVDVTSTAGTFAATATTLVDGRGSAVIAFTNTSMAEAVQGSSTSGLRGTSSKLLVVEDCGSSGPTAALSFAGNTNAVVCHDGMEAVTSASFAGSSAGATSLSSFALWIEGEEVQTSTSAKVDVSVSEVGIFEARGLVIDASYCADERVRTAYIGPDDGQPVGHLDAILSKTTLAAGSGKTTLSLSGVEACDGDPASGGRVYFRTDRGEITGAAVSGKGLRLTLDSSGDGSVTLDLADADTGGTGTVTLWVESGAAAGSQDFTVTGDARRPRVLRQDPVGYTTEDVEVVTFEFSEPMSSSSLLPSAFSVTGASSVTIDEVVRSGDREVEVWLASPVAGASGRWTVEVDSSVADVAGNRLDGAWTGAEADHVASFGKVATTAPDVTRCGGPKAFRPDGDDGSGIEADDIDISATADISASKWVWSVTDSTGSEVWLGRHVGGSRTTTLTWDGRDFDGAIVADGQYTVTVHAENGDRTAGDWCSVKVGVDNARGR